MSNKVYCLKCNFPTVYTSSIPNFCSKCGKPFIEKNNTTIHNATAQINKTEIQQDNVDIDENEDYYPEDSTSVPVLKKIEYSLTIPNLRPNRENGKDVIRQGTIEEAKEVLGKSKPKRTRVTKEQKARAKQNIERELKQILSSSKRQSTEVNP